MTSKIGQNIGFLENSGERRVGAKDKSKHRFQRRRWKITAFTFFGVTLLWLRAVGVGPLRSFAHHPAYQKASGRENTSKTTFELHVLFLLPSVNQAVRHTPPQGPNSNGTKPKQRNPEQRERGHFQRRRQTPRATGYVAPNSAFSRNLCVDNSWRVVYYLFILWIWASPRLWDITHFQLIHYGCGHQTCPPVDTQEVCCEFGADIRLTIFNMSLTLFSCQVWFWIAACLKLAPTKILTIFIWKSLHRMNARSGQSPIRK